MGKLKKQSSKNRKFTFNIVDALIILVFVAIVATFVYVFVLGKSFEDLYSDEVEITYTVSINEVKEETLKYISTGDKVYHSNKDKNTGVIVGVEQSPSVTNKGLDLKITISATARVNNEGVYSINGEIISKGSIIDVKFARYQPLEATCLGVLEK